MYGFKNPEINLNHALTKEDLDKHVMPIKKLSISLARWFMGINYIVAFCLFLPLVVMAATIGFGDGSVDKYWSFLDAFVSSLFLVALALFLALYATHKHLEQFSEINKEQEAELPVITSRSIAGEKYLRHVLEQGRQLTVFEFNQLARHHNTLFV